MAEELDPGDALRQLLAERERAKRAVYAAHMARERAEEERAHAEKLFKMLTEETQKLAADLARERAENSEWRAKRLLADEEVVRERNEFKERAENAERREKILEAILGRVEDELHSAALDETVVKEGEPSIEELNETTGDPHEGPHGPKWEVPLEEPADAMPFSRFGATPGRAIAAAARVVYRHWQVASLVAAAPFALMTLLLGLASYGVYVDALRPLWTPWPDDAVKWAVGLLGTSVFLFFPLNSLLRARRGKSPTMPVEPPAGPATKEEPPAEDESGDKEYLRVLKEIFAEEEDDADEGDFEG